MQTRPFKGPLPRGNAGFRASPKKAIFETPGKTSTLSKPDFTKNVGVTIGFILKRRTTKRGIFSIVQGSHL